MTLVTVLICAERLVSERIMLMRKRKIERSLSWLCHHHIVVGWLHKCFCEFAVDSALVHLSRCQ